jgi:hypothetical protein
MCTHIICIPLDSGIILQKIFIMSQSPKNSKKVTNPSSSIKKLIEQNKAKTSALKKMLKIIESDEINDEKVVKPKTIDKSSSIDR